MNTNLSSSHSAFPQKCRVRHLAAVALLWPSLLAFSPSASQATSATGGTYTTSTCTYYGTTKLWTFRTDPREVQAFQLTVTFDPFRARLHDNLAGGLSFKQPFNGVIDVSRAAAGILVLSGDTAAVTPGDVDIFELVFDDLQPGLPIDNVIFGVGATGGDFIQTFDPATNASATIASAQIGAVSRSAKPGISPMVWDADGGYDNGTTGGPGVWDTSTARFDSLPLPAAISGQTPADVPWNNTTNQHDIAVFGGNPGTGIVTLAGPISAGGLQFDISGYTLRGAGEMLTLSSAAGSIPTIDTAGNSAVVGFGLGIAGADGFLKLGSGTLTLTGPNTYSGTTVIKAGTVIVDASDPNGDGVFNSTDIALISQGLLNPSSNLTFAGNGKFEYKAVSGGFGGLQTSMTLGGLTFSAGDGNVQSTWSPGVVTGLTFSGFASGAGATGNFIVAGGTNGADNKISFSSAPPPNQLLSPRLYFNGTDFAAYDNGGFVRALNYGGDANTSQVDTIAPNTHVKLTPAFPGGALPDTAIRTLNLSGNPNLALNSGSVLTLIHGGLIKSGGGSSVIQGGAGLTTGGTAELVIRTDTTNDSLTLATPILSSSTGGLTKSGLGTLVLASANSYTGPTTVNAGKLLVNGSISPASAISLKQDATLGGSGQVGTIAGAGTVSPGTGAGILTATALDPALGMDFQFEFSQAAPLFGNAVASGNDLVRLTGSTPFAMQMGLTNTILVDFQKAVVTAGEIFYGGFFTDTNVDFSTDLMQAAFVSTLNGNPMPDGLFIRFDGFVPQTADFGGGPVSGRIAKIEVVPEPGSLLMLASGLALLAVRRRVRR